MLLGFGEGSMRRREFIAALGGAAVVWPLAAGAQQQAPKRPIIGFLNSGLPGGYAPFAAAFRRGLAEAGFIEGQNVVIEYRWAEGQYDRLPMMAADLIRRQVTLIAATSTPAALAAKAATSVIPIVFTVALDPVAAGLVISLNRPGGNATGVSNYLSDLGAKRLELLHEVVPKTTVIGMLVNPNYPDVEVQRKDAAEAAHKLGLELHVVNASTEGDFNSAFANLVQFTAGALLVGTDTFFLSRRDQLVLLAARHAIPSMYFLREFALAGGLMSYAATLHDGYRQASIYTGRILNGAKPADLPVVQPTKFDLVMNINTAKVLGLRNSSETAGARRRGDRMSNCVVGSGGSRLPCSTIAEHSVEGCDHFSHDGHDDDLGFFVGGDEAIVEGFEGGTVTACTEGGHVKDVTDRHPTTIDAAVSLELAAVEVIGCEADEGG